MLDGQGGGGVWAIMLALLFLMRGGWGHEGGGHYGHGGALPREGLDHAETNANFRGTNAHIEAEATKAAAANMHNQTLGGLVGIEKTVQFGNYEQLRGFDKLGYENAANTCKIVEAINCNGERTRDLIMKTNYENIIAHKDEIIGKLAAEKAEAKIIAGVLAGFGKGFPGFAGEPACRFAGV